MTLPYARYFYMLALVGLITSCGGLEWSPEGRSTTSYKKTSTAFRNATAVTVGPGDTVYALSRRHGVSQRDIIIANKLKAPYKLTVGQRIVLPRGTVYTVKKGDTLGRIANNYNVDLYGLARANSIGSPYTIYVDQQLRIPGTSTIVQTAGKTASQPPSRPSPAPSPPPSQSSGKKPPATEPAATAKSTIPAKVPPPPPSSNHGFIWPINGKVISSFGAKAGGLHNDGINIAATHGSPVKAVENGVVAYAGNQLRGFGNLLLVKHANGFITAYAHNAELLVRRGDKVMKGQDIATVGSTGNVNSPQLHFELRKGKKPLNPKKYLPKPRV